MEDNMTDEQKATVKAKLDEMKLKRAGKIPHDAKVQGVPNPMKDRPDAEKVGNVTKEAVQKIKDAGLMPDQMFHVGAELQLFAVNDMILNGLTNFGGEVEKYIEKRMAEYVKKEDVNSISEHETTINPTEKSANN